MATRKEAEKKPQISEISPMAAIAGGEFHIRGTGFAPPQGRPRVSFGDVDASVVIGSDSFVIARVPDGAAVGELVVHNDGKSSATHSCAIGVQVADNIHPVANPVVDAEGNIYTTLSGSRGQKTPVSVYRIDLNYEVKPFLTDLMNATSLAFDSEGLLYISSRYDGIVYQATPGGSVSTFVEGMNVATGLAFDRDGNLYVGDRRGTIWKISRDRQIYVFATLEESISAYHLAFGPDDHLYVTGPTTSSFDVLYRISPAGEVAIHYRGLGRPQGIAFDEDGRLYVAGSAAGRKGILRFAPEGGSPELFLSGPNIVGMAFTPSRSLVVATNAALFRADVNIKGKPLP
ncbi:MAG TPA: IPT/TIG domain-containing protein [Bryobacteraceae bacterium]|nr:IPT/TIG domain-containing protein [Bryobacteraceae bacterium]